MTDENDSAPGALTIAAVNSKANAKVASDGLRRTAGPADEFAQNKQNVAMLNSQIEALTAEAERYKAAGSMIPERLANDILFKTRSRDHELDSIERQAAARWDEHIASETNEIEQTYASEFEATVRRYQRQYKVSRDLAYQIVKDQEAAVGTDRLFPRVARVKAAVLERNK